MISEGNLGNNANVKKRDFMPECLPMIVTWHGVRYGSSMARCLSPARALVMGTTQQEKLELDLYTYSGSRNVSTVLNVLLYNTCVNSSFSYIQQSCVWVWVKPLHYLHPAGGTITLLTHCDIVDGAIIKYCKITAQQT